MALKCCLVFCIVACSIIHTRPSRLDPHLASFSTSFFEGWYFHILTATQKDLPSSLGLVVGYYPRGEDTWKNSFASILIQPSSPPYRLQTFSDFDQNYNITIQKDHHQIDRNPNPSNPPNFSIKSEKVSIEFFNEDCSMYMHIQSIYLTVVCGGSSEPYGPHFESPEGSFASFPTFLTGLHWYVHSMATPVQYILHKKQHNSVFHGKGLMHIEKNWGGSFPKGWIWAQGIAPDASPPPHNASHAQDRQCDATHRQHLHSSFVLAGGRPPTPLIHSIVPQVWLMGVHAGSLQWRLHPWDPTLYHITYRSCYSSENEMKRTSAAGRSACTATLKLTAIQPFKHRQVELLIAAPSHSFTLLDCPGKQGFEKLSMHSYSGEAKLRLYTSNPTNDKVYSWYWFEKMKSVFATRKIGIDDKARTLIFSETFEHVAIEFGGEFRK